MSHLDEFRLHVRLGNAVAASNWALDVPGLGNTDRITKLKAAHSVLARWSWVGDGTRTRINRLYDQAQRSDTLKPPKTPPESDSWAAIFPLAIMGSGHPGVVGAVRILTVATREASNTANDRFHGVHRPRNQAFLDAVQRAHELANQCRAGVTTQTTWGLLPDIASNADLYDESVALAAYVAMIAYIIRRPSSVDDRAFSGVLRSGHHHFTPPDPRTIGDKCAVLARECAPVRYLYVPAPIDLREAQSGNGGVKVVPIEHSDRDAFLGRLFGHDDKWMAAQLKHVSVPPNVQTEPLLSVVAPPQTLALSYPPPGMTDESTFRHRIEALVVADHPTPLDAGLLVKALSLQGIWPGQLAVPEPLGPAIDPLIRAGRLNVSPQPSLGRDAVVYTACVSSRQVDSHALVCAHKALARVGHHPIFHAILGGDRDLLVNAIPDVAPGDMEPHWHSAAIRALGESVATTVGVLDAMAGELSGRGLWADLLMLGVRSHGMAEPWRTLGRSVLGHGDSRELLFALQAYLEAILHGALALRWAFGPAPDKVNKDLERLSERPNLGDLWKATTKPPCVDEGPFGKLSRAIEAAFRDTSVVNSLNSLLHGVGRWDALADAPHEELTATCQVVAKGLLGVSGALGHSPLARWAPRVDGSVVFEPSGQSGARQLNGLVWALPQDVLFYRGVVGHRIRYWSFTSPTVAWTDAPTSVAASDLLWSPARLADVALPRIEESAPRKETPRRIRLDQFPQPIATCVSQLSREGQHRSFWKHMSLVDMALTSLLRIALFAARAGKDSILPHNVGGARLTKRTMLDALVVVAEGEMPQAASRLAKSVASPGAHERVMGLICDLERLAHIPMGPSAAHDGRLENLVLEARQKLLHILFHTPFQDGALSLRHCVGNESTSLLGFPTSAHAQETTEAVALSGTVVLGDQDAHADLGARAVVLASAGGVSLGLLRAPPTKPSRPDTYRYYYVTRVGQVRSFPPA